MKRINRERAPKGTVTVRKKGNSFEARVTLELVAIMKGVGKNPRLSRTAKTADEARKRLGEHIVEVYNSAQLQLSRSKVFTDECSQQLENFSEYQTAIKEKKFGEVASEYINFYNIVLDWFNWKRKQVNPVTGRKLGEKSVETYAYTIKNHIKPKFENINIFDVTKDMVEEYIEEKKTHKERTAKDTLSIIKNALIYARDEKGIIKEVPKFDIIFKKKNKRLIKKQIPYLSEERREVWLDILEKDGREFCLLFAAILQNGMRPEEGCGLRWVDVLFEENFMNLCNAYKEVSLYDDDLNRIGHKRSDGELKTNDSYRKIPMCKRLKNMLLDLKTKRKEYYSNIGKKWDENDYVFLNQNGEPYVAERLYDKIVNIRKKYSLEHMTVYGLRHTYATIMSKRGKDKEVLKELMGHADYDTTNSYYVHIDDDWKLKECRKVEQQLEKEKGNNKKRIVRYTRKKSSKPKRKIKIPKIA